MIPLQRDVDVYIEMCIPVCLVVRNKNRGYAYNDYSSFIPGDVFWYFLPTLRQA